MILSFGSVIILLFMSSSFIYYIPWYLIWKHSSNECQYGSFTIINTLKTNLKWHLHLPIYFCKIKRKVLWLFRFRKKCLKKCLNHKERSLKRNIKKNYNLLFAAKEGVNKTNVPIYSFLGYVIVHTRCIQTSKCVNVQQQIHKKKKKVVGVH